MHIYISQYDFFLDEERNQNLHKQQNFITIHTINSYEEINSHGVVKMESKKMV